QASGEDWEPEGVGDNDVGRRQEARHADRIEQVFEEVDGDFSASSELSAAEVADAAGGFIGFVIGGGAGGEGDVVAFGGGSDGQVMPEALDGAAGGRGSGEEGSGDDRDFHPVISMRPPACGTSF